MSERFPPFESDNELGRDIESDLKKHFGSNITFKWRDDEGALIGPFAVLSYTPDLFRPWMMFGDAVLKQQHFSPRSREITCLAVMAVYDVPFIGHAHERIGLQVGLWQAQISSAVNGTTPEGLTEAEVVTYTLALKLAHARGPVDAESWQDAESKIGRGGAARAAHVVAWFIYNSTLLNLGAIGVPSD